MSESSPKSVDETDELFEEMSDIHDGLPDTMASMDCYDIEADPFEEEWIVGSSISANIVTRSGPLGRALKKASEDLDIGFTEREYVLIEGRDVDNMSTDRVRVPKDVFENMIEWYVEQRPTNAVAEDTDTHSETVRGENDE